MIYSMPQAPQKYDLSEGFYHLIHGVVEVLFIKLWYIWPLLLGIAFVQNRISRIGRR